MGIKLAGHTLEKINCLTIFIGGPLLFLRYSRRGMSKILIKELNRLILRYFISLGYLGDSLGSEIFLLILRSQFKSRFCLTYFAK